MTAQGQRQAGRELVDVCALDDLREGATTPVTIAGRPAAVVRLGDRVYAVGGQCPHRGGPLTAGTVRYATSGCPGEITVDRDVPVIACPWHGWEFALADGRALADPTVRARVHAVEVRDGRVLAWSRKQGS